MAGRVRVRRAQVQRFGPAGTMNGTHLLFTPAFPPRFTGAERLLTAWHGPVDSWEQAASTPRSPRRSPS